jgi:hypothetical protein
MKIEVKGGSAVALIFVLGLGLVQCLVLYAINPSIYGVSFGYRLGFPGQGTIFRETLTPKTRDIDSRIFFLREGDQVEVDLDLNVESGYLYFSFIRRFPGYELVFSRIFQTDTLETMTFTSPRTGIYQIGTRIHKYEGSVRISWDY